MRSFKISVGSFSDGVQHLMHLQQEAIIVDTNLEAKDSAEAMTIEYEYITTHIKLLQQNLDFDAKKFKQISN